jgi:hypothetical protein
MNLERGRAANLVQWRGHENKEGRSWFDVRTILDNSIRDAFRSDEIDRQMKICLYALDRRHYNGVSCLP